MTKLTLEKCFYQNGCFKCIYENDVYHVNIVESPKSGEIACYAAPKEELKGLWLSAIYSAGGWTITNELSRYIKLEDLSGFLERAQETSAFLQYVEKDLEALVAAARMIPEQEKEEQDEPSK
jgi:hypothetical protein